MIIPGSEADGNANYSANDSVTIQQIDEVIASRPNGFAPRICKTFEPPICSAFSCTEFSTHVTEWQASFNKETRRHYCEIHIKAFLRVYPELKTTRVKTLGS